MILNTLQQGKRRQVDLKTRWKKGNELQSLRIAAKTDHNIEVVEALSKAETEARQHGMLEIICMRQQSRVMWLKWGDTPIKYFFNQLKAK